MLTDDEGEMTAELMDLIAKWQEAGASMDEIISTVELRLMALREEAEDA